MPSFELHNLRAIDSLNQRGGRMLSMVDLVAAGTLSLDMAAELAYVAANGGSFLTAAGPGGVGKTTLMGAALAFLTPGTEIVAIEGPETLDTLHAPSAGRPQCLVVHEIGHGHFHGYLWGRDVGRYFDLTHAPGRCLASNLHAQTYAEARDRLLGLPLGVSPEALGWIDALAFMEAVRGKRRVVSLWTTDGTPALSKAGGSDGPPVGHRETWRWRPQDDTFEAIGPPAAETIAGTRGMTAESVSREIGRLRTILESSLHEGARPMEDLRNRTLREFFGRSL